MGGQVLLLTGLCLSALAYSLEQSLPGCKTDEDCSTDLSCVKEKCVNSCINHDCGTKAKCEVIQHVLTCVTILDSGTCESDSNCSSGKACIQDKCIDPCNNSTCTVGQCRALNHQAVCISEPNQECMDDTSCSQDQKCVNKKCLDPCLFIDCEINDKCQTANHIVKCVPNDCETDSSCLDGKRCLNNKCVDPCTLITCNEKERCLANSCKTTCIANEHYCESDASCTLGQTCIQNKCIDLCDYVKCGGNSFCEAIDHKAHCSENITEISPVLNRNEAEGSQATIDKKYFLYNSKMNFFQAIEFCYRKGQRLATINSEVEFNELVKLIKDKHGDDPDASYWTSGSDLAEWGKHVWLTTSQAFTYTNWYPGEPNHAGGKEEACIYLEADFQHRMNDNPCDRTEFVACEIAQ